MGSACLLTGQFGYKIGSGRFWTCVRCKHIVKVMIYSYNMLLPTYFGKYLMGMFVFVCLLQGAYNHRGIIFFKQLIFKCMRRL